MSDYISRENTVRQICKIAEQLPEDKRSPYVMTALYIQDNKEMFPSADVRENIHGEWEEVTDYKDDNVYQWHIICSVCRQRGMFESDNFCPNCGADMRGE
jgi:dTDP-glucose pyrophosphorylase